MTRSELEHIIRAAGDVAHAQRIVVIGSQAILGEFPDAPLTLLASTEADVYPQRQDGCNARSRGPVPGGA